MHSLDYSSTLQSLAHSTRWHWISVITQLPIFCSPLQLLQKLRGQRYLTSGAPMHSLLAGKARLSHATKGWSLLGHERCILGTTIGRYCLDKCWHGRYRAKRSSDPARAAETHACPPCLTSDTPYTLLSLTSAD